MKRVLIGVGFAIWVLVLGRVTLAQSTNNYWDWHETPTHIYDSHDEHVAAYCLDGSVAKLYGYDHWLHESWEYEHPWNSEANAHEHIPTGRVAFYIGEHYVHTHYFTCPPVA